MVYCGINSASDAVMIKKCKTARDEVKLSAECYSL